MLGISVDEGCKPVKIRGAKRGGNGITTLRKHIRTVKEGDN